MQQLSHPIAPVYDTASRILILGSFPSVASRAALFFYGHPQNRFWPLLAALLHEPVPQSVEQKRALVLRRHIALWDTIGSCQIEGSSDSSIRAVVQNDLRPLLQAAPIRQIFCNGAASYQAFCRYQQPLTGRAAIKLPSTSPANAAWSLPRLTEAWRCILAPLQADEA